MDAGSRIENALLAAVSMADFPSCPPLLGQAMQHAVFPRGARVRPRLCLAVASACGEDMPVLTDAAATAIELLHCASLVHDDLPCFDNAATRRGRPSVHKAFGEPLAVLTGDALIVMAFQLFGRLTAPGDRLQSILLTVGRSTGVPSGIVAGQAWECEPKVDLAHYHRSKTGALFAAAAVAGAASAGKDAEAWRPFGEYLGESYQVADDLRDSAGDEDEIGKPVGQDAALGRPSAVAELGIEGAIHRLHSLVASAIEAMPPCSGASMLRAMMQSEVKRLVPKKLAQFAA